MSAIYGNGNTVRRPSQTSNSMMPHAANNLSILNTSEYADTLGRGTVNNYLSQLSNYPVNMMMMQGGGNTMNNNTNNSGMLNTSQASVGYASSKDIGLIRTNLNNFDYASNATMYRRPQLHPTVYDPTGFAHQPSYQPPGQQNAPPPPPMQQQQHVHHDTLYGSSVLPPPPPPSSLFAGNSSHMPPPPPPPTHAPQVEHHLENKIFAGVDDDDDEDNLDHDIIPNWVPIDKCLEKVITVFDYEGSREDELSFKENMYIYVIKKNDDHWYEGIMKNENGDIIQGSCLIAIFEVNLRVYAAYSFNSL
jgi:hypothetical protein